MIDLVIWTLNSERYLQQVLTRAVSVVPDSELDKLIVVDGGSADRTLKIARELGWKTYIAQKGIPYQANVALKHVTSEFFGSVEHDVLLAKDWFSLMHHMNNLDVAVVQGIRVPTHPVLRAFDNEIYSYQKRRVEDYGVSLDNHIYRTDDIRAMGGFPTDYPIAVDRALRDRVWSFGKKWIIDSSIVSDHIKDSLWKSLKHDYHLLQQIKKEDQLATLGRVTGFLVSPVHALRVVKHTGEPRLFPYLLVHKFVRFVVMLHRYHAIKKARAKKGDA